MVFAMAAEIERDLISQRTKEALAAQKRAGKKLGRPMGSGKSKLDRHRPEQLRAFDAAASGAALGVPVLLAFCSALLEKSLKGDMIATGSLNRRRFGQVSCREGGNHFAHSHFGTPPIKRTER